MIDYRTLKKIPEEANKPKIKRNLREFMNFIAGNVLKIKNQVLKTHNLSNKSIFDAYGMQNVPRTTRCEPLRKIFFS